MSTPESAAAPLPFGGQPPGYIIVFLGALIALGPMSMNAYIPAIPAIAADFGVDQVSINYTLSIFLVGFALGQYFGGAISDQVGRKRIGYLGLSLYIVSALAITFTQTVGAMLFLRFFQALGGGFTIVICMASIRDVYPIEELGRRFATATSITLIAPLVAPTLGSLLLSFGWQAIFLFKVAFAATMFALYSVLVPETVAGHWRNVSFGSIFVSFREVVTRRVDGRMVPLRLILLVGFASSLLMNFVTNSSTVYLEYFGVSPRVFPVLFACTVVGFLAMNIVSMRILKPENAVQLLKIGLRVQLAAAVLLLIEIAAGYVTLFTVLPVLVVIVATLGLINPAGSSTYMSNFSKLAGSAASAFTTVMFAGGALFGAITASFYDGSLLPLAATMIVASALGNAISLGLQQPAAR